MDDSAALVIERLIETAKVENTECIVMGLDGLPATTLNALNVLKDIPEDRFVQGIDEARETAKRILDEK